MEGAMRLRLLLILPLLLLGCSKVYDKAQLWKKETFKEGNKDGAYEISYLGLTEKGTYKDGKPHGPVETYYKDGQLKAKGTFKEGKKDGLFEEYRQNGTLKWQEVWKDGELMELKPPPVK